MKQNLHTWLVLFGGAGREKVVKQLTNEGYIIQAVIVPSKRSKELKKSISKITSMGHKIIQSTPKELDRILRIYSAQNILSVGYPYIIPENILKRYETSINIHPTLLPKYRGPTTGAYILMNNENESGSTVHFMTKEVDAGDIVLQKKVNLSPFDTIKSLQRKVYAIEPELISKALKLLGDNSFKKQDLANGSIYPKRRKPSDSQIDPNKSLMDLFDEIRASDPQEFPAFFYYKGEKVNVKLWREKKPEGSEDEI